MIGLFALFFCLLNSSDKSLSLSSSTWQLLAGRDNGDSLERPVLYRALTPAHWIRCDSSVTESIADTTKAICEFYIQEDDRSIRLTIHTFPIVESHIRIPPQAQVARWKKQFEEIDCLANQILPDSHGGFSGLFFEGQGILQGTPHKVMGWSMQLASIYERQLNQENSPLDSRKRADYTIKANGPPDLINKHRADLLLFAHSFELIDELPSPP